MDTYPNTTHKPQWMLLCSEGVVARVRKASRAVVACNRAAQRSTRSWEPIEPEQRRDRATHTAAQKLAALTGKQGNQQRAHRQHRQQRHFAGLGREVAATPGQIITAQFRSVCAAWRSGAHLNGAAVAVTVEAGTMTCAFASETGTRSDYEALARHRERVGIVKQTSQATPG